MLQETKLPIYNKKIARDFGRAISEFHMIQEGDEILVGLSGGKDSSLLLYLLSRLKLRSPVSFNVQAVTVVPDGGAADLSELYSFADSLNVNLEVIDYPIFNVLESSVSSSPCSLCANIRRGILAGKAQELGCGVLALGHHKDDAVETVLLNLFFAGSFKCFHPNMFMSRSKVRVIRPMVYIGEDAIKKEVARLELPTVEFSCKYSKSSQRGHIKSMLKEMSKSAPTLYSNVLHALMSVKREDVWSSEL